MIEPRGRRKQEGVQFGTYMHAKDKSGEGDPVRVCVKLYPGVRGSHGLLGGLAHGLQTAGREVGKATICGSIHLFSYPHDV